MRILVAPDKFKGSLTAREAASAMASGIREAFPEAEIDEVPLADGGEGTVEIAAALPGAEVRNAVCRDAIGRPVRAAYAWIPDERLAVLEMSAASGLAGIPMDRRDPLRASTFGTGELMRDALALRPSVLAVGLGGSATNDAGAGMAAGLGWKFLDHDGRDVAPLPFHFQELTAIRPMAFPEDVRVVGLCDVRNPLLGERGCSRVFSPQKGAGAREVECLENRLRRFADLCSAELGRDFRDEPGAGAAGGLGFGLMTFCGARLVSGFEWIAGRLGLDGRIASSDIVITGEGSLDEQTLEGKGPSAIAAMARRHGRPCIALAGRVQDAARKDFTQCRAICGPAIKLADAMAHASQLLRSAAASAARDFFL